MGLGRLSNLIQYLLSSSRLSESAQKGRREGVVSNQTVDMINSANKKIVGCPELISIFKDKL